MPAYRVLLSGTNVLMDIDGERQFYGFEVTRFVVAADAEQAAEAALGLIQSSPQLGRGARNDANDPPLYTVSEIQTLGPDEEAPAMQPGFAFFPVDGGAPRP